MRTARHTVISLAIALATAGVAWAIGIGQGSALILGALGGIIASVVMQRSAMKTSTVITGSDEPEDIAAAVQTAGDAVLQIRAQAAQIADSDVSEIANQLGEKLTSALTMSHTEDRAGVIPLILDQLIEPAQALLTDYLWLQKRGGTASQDAMTKIATRDLPAAEHSARQVVAVLERPGPVDVTAVRRAVDFQFSFGGETVSASPEMWGNRQRFVDEAERLKSE
ncbi:hypothetical protein BH20CHL4_BH20CHL4_04290 [soil metagenome]